MKVTTSGWAAPFISELSSKLSEQRHKKPKLTKFTTSNFYSYQSRSNSIQTTQVEVNTNIYPVILLQSLEDVLPGTLRTLSKPDENQGKKRLVTSDKSKTLKSQKNSNMQAKDENLDELCDTKLLDSYLQYV